MAHIVTISLKYELLEELDKARGDTSRSKFIARAVEQRLEKEFERK